MAKANKNRVTKGKNYSANLALYQLYANVIAGGRQLLKPPKGTLHPITGAGLSNGSYLIRLSGETIDRDGGDPWQRRRNAAAHIPISAEVVDTHVDSMSRQGVDRTAVAEMLPDIVGRTDQARARTATWVNTAFSLGLSQGWLGALVDAPVVRDGQYPSQAHLEAAGLRPYAQLLLPRRFWQLELDRDGSVIYALVKESEERFGEWYPDRYTALNPDGTPIEGPVRIPIGRIPIEIFTAADSDPDDELAPPGDSVIRAVSFIDLQILNHLSWIDDLITKAGFCLLHANGPEPAPPIEGEPEEDMQVGPGFIWYFQGEVNWKAPPAELIKVLWEHVVHMRQEAYRVGGVYQRSQDMAEASSGIAIKYERAPIDNRVVRWAQNLQDWETRLWRLVAEVAGLDPGGVEVTYPEDFSQLPFNADVEQSQELASIYGGYEGAPDWVRRGIDAKVRRALMRDVGHVPSVREALAEADKAPVQPPKLPDVSPVQVQVPGQKTDEADEKASEGGSVSRSEEIEANLKVIEQLVKAKAPDEMVRQLVLRIASELEVDTPEVQEAIGDAVFRWYTEVQAEVSAGVTAEEISKEQK